MNNLNFVASTLIQALTNSTTIGTKELYTFVQNEYNNYLLMDFFGPIGLIVGFLVIMMVCFCCDAVYCNSEANRPYDPNYDPNLGPHAQWFRKQYCYVCGKKHQRTNIGPCKNGHERPLWYSGNSYQRFDADNSHANV